MIYMLSFKSNNKLDISRISIEPIIKNDFNVDYSQPLEEILKIDILIIIIKFYGVQKINFLIGDYKITMINLSSLFL